MTDQSLLDQGLALLKALVSPHNSPDDHEWRCLAYNSNEGDTGAALQAVLDAVTASEAELAKLQAALDWLYGSPFSDRAYRALKSRAELAEAELARLREERDKALRDLAKCYRLTGADPDGNTDEILGLHAEAEVSRLRKDHDALEQQQADLRAALNGLSERLRCRHAKRTGGNDYLECQACGLIWDYRKETPDARALADLDAIRAQFDGQTGSTQTP